MTVVRSRALLAGMAHQTARLIQRLSAIREPDYPREAVRIGFLLKAVAGFVRERVHRIYEITSPDVPLEELMRARKLLGTVQRLHSYVRFLEASQSQHSPPSLQAAITALAMPFFKAGDRTVVLVRPQWKYNLKYIGLDWVLRSEINLHWLDPTNQLGLLNPELSQAELADKILDQLWSVAIQSVDDRTQKELGDRPPSHVAVLSFAGLDTTDAFQFPLLAHELGHFLDFSQEPAHHEASVVSSYIPIETIEQHVGTELKQHELEVAWTLANQRARVCIEEILADLIAVRLMGFAFFVAQANFLSRTAEWPQPRVTNSGYPGIAYRLSHVLRELRSIAPFLFRSNGESDVNETPAAAAPIRFAQNYLAQWQADVDGALEGLDSLAEREKSVDDKINDVVATAVESVVPALDQVARELVTSSTAGVNSESLTQRVDALASDLPPYVPGDDSKAFAEIMAAAWIFRLIRFDSQPIDTDQPEDEEAFNKMCRLVMKAIELGTGGEFIHSDFRPQPQPSDWRDSSGALGEAEIRDRMQLPLADVHRLTVMPISDDAIQSASIDVTLGNWFRVARRPRLPAIDLTTRIGRELATQIAHDELFIPFGASLTIHPGDFVLGVTLEFVALPNDVLAFVEGKSRLGRTGLIVATATQVAPGFHGAIVLELANAGAVPLKIQPGAPVAQLVLIRLSSPAAPYAGSSQCQTRP